MQTKTKNSYQHQKVNYNGTPLDYSFMQLDKIEQVQNVKPRKGQVKQVYEQKIEEAQFRKTQNMGTFVISQEKKKEKFIVNTYCSAINISYNNLSSIAAFEKVINSVMYKPENLQWLDLAHNKIQYLDYSFESFPNIKLMNLHCNLIHDLKTFANLQSLKELRSLSIHGNPLETIQDFRIYLSLILPQLKKIDTVMLSKIEKDNAQTWVKNYAITFPKVNSKKLRVYLELKEIDQ